MRWDHRYGIRAHRLIDVLTTLGLIDAKDFWAIRKMLVQRLGEYDALLEQAKARRHQDSKKPNMGTQSSAGDHRS